jgi:hypothetical protein
VISNILNFKSLCGVFQHLTTLCELQIENFEEFDLCNDEDGCYLLQHEMERTSEPQSVDVPSNPKNEIFS